MKAKRILFVSPFFYPEAISTGRYNRVLVLALVEQGAKVDVVASHPFYPAWRPVFSEDRLEGAAIHRGGAWVRYPRRLVLRRMVLEAWFAWHAAWKTYFLGKHADTVIGVFPPSLFFWLVNRLVPSARRVGIVHDLQGILGFDGNGMLRRLLCRGVHLIEKRVFSSCDRLIVLSRGMARTAIAEYGLDPRKVAVCYPFVSLSRDRRIGSKLAYLLPDKVQHVVYSGALGKKQNSFGLLEFFRAAAAQLPDTQFHIFSQGPIFDEFRRRAVGVRIQFHSLVDDADLGELYARSSVQVVPQLEGSADACLPSKLPNILACGCVVLAICEPKSELAEIIRQAGTGVVAESWQHDLLIKRLRQALEKTTTQTRAERQVLASPLLASQFSLKSLVAAVLGIPQSQPQETVAPVISGLDYSRSSSAATLPCSD